MNDVASVVIYLGGAGGSPPLGGAGRVLSLAQRARVRGQRLTLALCIVIGLTSLEGEGGGGSACRPKQGGKERKWKGHNEKRPRGTGGGQKQIKHVY